MGGDELNIEGYSVLELPNVAEELEEAMKPQAALPKGTYLAVITDAYPHYGDHKEGRPGRSVGVMVETAINPATRIENPLDEVVWTASERMVPSKDYVWIGYLNTETAKIQYGKNQSDRMNRGLASFLNAVGAASGFNGSEHIGKIVKVVVDHREYTGNDGEERLGIDVKWFNRHEENGEIRRLDLPKPQESAEGSGSPASPFD